MVLSPFERLALAELMEIHQLLAKNSDYEMNITALRDGYPDFYGLQYFEEELSADKATFVRDVFSLYQKLQDALKLDSGGVPDHAKCRGFDGNHATSLYGFARFLLNHNQWTSIVGDSDFPNSHGGQPDYRRMLSKQKEILDSRQGSTLTADEATSIIEAG